MPRLKPPPSRQAAPETEIEDYIAPDGPIEIELESDPVGDTEISLTPSSSAPAAPLAAEIEDDPLKKALDAQKRAEDLLRVEQARSVDAARRDRERDLELERVRGESEDAQYNSVLTAIAAEQSALDKAESDYAAFAAAGDWAAAGKSQRVMATSSARIDRLEDGKITFDQRREAAKTAPQPQVTQQPLDLESKMAKVPEQAKPWLRLHPEYINDTALNQKIGVVHGYLIDIEKKEPFSADYFTALEDRLGIKKAPAALTPEPEPHQPQRRSMPLSAPVSRDVPTASGQRQSTGVTLSEEERRIARTSFTATDMTDRQKEIMYAKNKQRLAAMRSNGQYPTREQG